MAITLPSSSLPPADPQAAPARGKIRVDATTYLTIYIVLLFAVPSHMTILALGTLGNLSVLWGLVGLAWWTFVRVQNLTPVLRGSRPVKAALVAFFGIVMFSYGAGQLVGIPSENSAWAEAAFIRSLSWAGVALVAIDGITHRTRYMTLLRRLIRGGAMVAVLGLAQFATGQALVNTITLPGFGSEPEYATVFDRSGFTRAAGTASHPLAYGTLLVMLLPMSLTMGAAERHLNVFWRWGPSVVLGLATITSMSRSVLVGLIVGLILIFPTVPRHYRWLTTGIGLGLMVIISFTVPGMLSSLRDMFFTTGNESSSASRTDSLGPAIEIALRNPWLGQGLGSFMPTELILDNAILLMFIELGGLGLATFLGVMMVCAWAGLTIWTHDQDSRFKYYGAGLLGAVISGLMNMAFYDALSFSMASGLTFLIVGLTGAALGLHRLGPQLDVDDVAFAPVTVSRAGGGTVQPTGRRARSRNSDARTDQV
ncbi:O-antigen ligase family protein [Micrococcus terreus]|uniref:O-antigen ligase family protein n=1 Tax=Micrococcus terreus TaxID=574650 RepID=UPI0033E78729